MTTPFDRLVPVFAVADVKAAIEWYQNALGFQTGFINREEDDESGDTWIYALLDNHDVEIHLCRVVPDDRTLSSPSNCYLFVKDLPTLHRHLQALNVDVTEPTEMPWGTLECWLHDPDGNRIVLSDGS